MVSFDSGLFSSLELFAGSWQSGKPLRRLALSLQASHRHWYICLAPVNIYTYTPISSPREDMVTNTKR